MTHKQNDLFRKVFEHSNDAIFILDPARDKILDANPRACKMLEYTRKELLTLPISAIHPEEMPQLWAFAQSVFEQKHGFTDELTCFTRSGKYLPAEISASTIEIEKSTCILAMVRDITDRKEAEKARHEAERCRVLMETAGAAAHEINQPLTVIIGASEILLQTEHPVDALRDNIAQILKAGQRINDIVRNMRKIQQYATKPYVEKMHIVDFNAAQERRKTKDERRKEEDER